MIVTSRRLISNVLPFGRLWYGEPNAVSNAIGYAKFRSHSHNAVIRVYDEAGNVLETHDHAGDCEGRERIIRENSIHISLDVTPA